MYHMQSLYVSHLTDDVFLLVSSIFFSVYNSSQTSNAFCLACMYYSSISRCMGELIWNNNSLHKVGEHFFKGGIILFIYGCRINV